GGGHVLRPHGRVHGGGDAVAQEDRPLEVVLGDDPAMLAVVVGVDVDEAGDDRLAAGVEGASPRRYRAATHTGDAVAAHEERPVHHLAVPEGDDAGVGEGDAPVGDVARHGEG